MCWYPLVRHMASEALVKSDRAADDGQSHICGDSRQRLDDEEHIANQRIATYLDVSSLTHGVGP